MATYADLITSIKYQLRDTVGNKWPGAEIMDYINRGHRIICTRLAQLRNDLVRLNTTIPTVSGTERYCIPTGLQAIEFIQIDTEANPMSAVNMSFIETYDNKFIPDHWDVPTSYCLHSGWIYVRPIPDVVYTMNIYYYGEITTNLDTSNTTQFNGIADEVMIAFAVKMALAREEHNTSLQDQAISTLLRMADILFKRREKSLKRINAYRWEYEGLV